MIIPFRHTRSVRVKTDSKTKSAQVFWAVEMTKDYWDQRYESMDLLGQRKSRQLNVEYISFIEASLTTCGISEKSPRDEVKIIETGCGSGPLGAHLLDQGYQTEFCDYSEPLVRRLREESGYRAFVADCSDLSGVQNETYDVVILAGTVYESADYFFPCRVYAEINRVLKKGGVFIHFLNAHNTPFYQFEQSLAGRVLAIPANILGAVISPFESVKSNNIVRFLARRPLINIPSFWLYHHGDIRNMLVTNKFDVQELSFLQMESGICTFLPFLAKKARNRYSEPAEYTDMMFVERNELLPKAAIHLADFLRNKWPALGKSIGILAVKI